jgi:hypothetical protein
MALALALAPVLMRPMPPALPPALAFAPSARTAAKTATAPHVNIVAGIKRGSCAMVESFCLRLLDKIERGSDGLLDAIECGMRRYRAFQSVEIGLVTQLVRVATVP